MKQEFFMLAEAVAELKMPEHAVRRLIQDGDLPICFDAAEELTGVSIQSPDGTIETVALPVSITGTLSCFSHEIDGDAMMAGYVQVLKVRSVSSNRNLDGVLIRGHKLPTVGDSYGFLKPGYRVSGFVDLLRVEAKDWLFFVDDLKSLKDGVTSRRPEKATLPGTSTALLEVTGDADDDNIAALFDPVKAAQLEAMFPDSGKWKAFTERADRNGLKDAAKNGRAVFNPYRAAIWWLTTGPKGWALDRCIRVLANNLPARSIDSKHLLTGEYE